MHIAENGSEDKDSLISQAHGGNAGLDELHRPRHGVAGGNQLGRKAVPLENSSPT